MIASAVTVSMAIAGCAVPGSQGGGASTSSSDDSTTGKTVAQSVACLGGGLAGLFLAKALAQSETKRLKLNAAQAAKRQQGYVIAFALVGCGGAAALAGTAYSKLSESGKRAREQELLNAAASAKPRTYRDPQNPALIGTAKPQPVYADAGNNRECRDIEDTLADEGKGEPIVVKYCRPLPSGAWSPVTA